MDDNYYSQLPAPSNQLPNSAEYITPPPPKHEGIKSILSTLLLLITAPLIALMLTTFVFQSYEVDGPSMETALQHRDRLIVLKLGKTWAKVTNNSFIPKRGDIVIFTSDSISEFGAAEDKQLIKRVIALPGERIVIQAGKITVYNEEHPSGFDPDSLDNYGDSISHTSGNIDMIVPKNHVFVSGDNRSNSLDSRNFGPISSDDIIGTLSLRVFPLNKIDSF